MSYANDVFVISLRETQAQFQITGVVQVRTGPRSESVKSSLRANHSYENVFRFMQIKIIFV